ncbi:MAG: ankyrin repeat domain-containing protein [Pseudomonadales bacterium]
MRKNYGAHNDPGRAFLRAAETGNADRVGAFLEDGFSVNYQDPGTGETALHAAAGTRARDVFRRILEEPDIDYLLRDHKGRLPSEVAYVYGRDPAMARLLAIKEKAQARTQGLVLTRRTTTPA